MIRSPDRGRRAARHLVELPCEVITTDSEVPALRWASDMSATGLWLDTEEVLPLGTELVVCFRPAVRWRARELMVFGEVTRASGGRRAEDPGPGMGVAFLDLGAGERFALRSWLRPRPYLRPRRRAAVRPALPEWPRSDHPFAARLS